MKSKQKTGLKNFGSYDLYKFYINKLLDKNPTYKGVGDRSIRRKGVLSIIDVREWVKKPVIDYSTYISIISLFNKKASEEIIKGNTLSLSFGLGALEARRVERNLKSPKVDIISTMAERRKGNPTAWVYYTDEDYCRVGWEKLGNVKNCAMYEFKPSGPFRAQFSKSLKGSRLLKYKYTYYEYDSRRVSPEKLALYAKNRELKIQQQEQLKLAA